LLESAFLPQELLIRDDSHLHEGHAGAREGKGHYFVEIVSDAFEGRRRIEIHQMIYDALGDMMNTDIHALSISAEPPSVGQDIEK
jgi:BolA protein